MNFLLSFPRSGNSLVRFFVEKVSGQKTYDCGGEDSVSILDLYSTSEKSSGSVIMRKAHFWREINLFSDPNKRVVLLIRDYKGCIISNIKRGGGEIPHSLSIYLELIQKFDEFSGPKMVSYYEDFVKDPKGLLPIAEFLNLDKDKIQEYLDSSEELSKESLSKYSAINGNLTADGSKHDLTENQLKEFEVVKSFPLYEKYLKRYG